MVCEIHLKIVIKNKKLITVTSFDFKRVLHAMLE